MKKLALLFIAFILLSGTESYAQWMLINKNGGSPHGSAALEIADTSRGILIPRLSDAQMNSVASPAAGLLIYNTDSNSFYFNNGSGWATISSSGATQYSVPAGTIMPFGGDSAHVPAGFLLCDGTSLDTNSYSELYNAIGSSWGGSGTNFNIPDLRGRFIRGTDYGAANDPDRASRSAINTGGNTGDEVGSLQSDELKSHTHSIKTNDADGSGTGIDNASNAVSRTVNDKVNSTGGNETRPKNANVNYIICYSSSVAAAGTNSAVFQGSVTSAQLPNSIKDSSRITDNDGSAKVEALSSDKIEFTTNSNKNMILDINGNLGLGTTSPTDELVIVDTGIVAVRLGVDQTDKYLKLDYNQTYDIASIQGGQYGGTTRPLVLQGGGGNVGVGDDTPDSLLTVGGGLQASNIHVNSGNILLENTFSIQAKTFGGDIANILSTNTNDNVVVGNQTWDKIRFRVDGKSHAAMLTGDGLSIGGIRDSTDSMLVVNGGIQARAIRLFEGAQSGYVLTSSDMTGKASWQPPASGADDLGDHTATTTIQLNGNKISNDGGNEGLSVANDGMLTATPATTGAGNLAVIANGDYRTTGNGTGYYMTNSSIGITGNNSNTGDMRIKTGGSDRIRITGGGQVGVGTTNPAYTLDVNGDLMANGNRILVTDSAGGLIEYSGQQNTSYRSYGSYIRPVTNPPDGEAIFRVLSQGGAERLRVEHNGYVRASNGLTITGDVGIGTTNPTQKLDVSGNVRVDSLVIHDGTNSPSAGDVLTAAGADGKAYWASAPSGADNLGNHTATTNIQLNGNYLSNDGGNEGIQVSNNGATTITANDLNVLTLQQNTDGKSSYLEIIGRRSGFVESNDLGRLDFRNYDSNLSGGTEYPVARVSGYSANNNSTEGNLRFQTNNGSGLQRAAMVITKDQQVGIGTTTPTTELHITDSTGATNVILENASNSDADMRFQFREDGTTQFSFGYDDGLDALVWSGSAWTGNRRMRLYKDGRLVVGNTTPDSLLEVVGGIEAQYIKLSGGAGNGKVLTSDATGSASWQTPVSSADNMGNHTATTNIQLNGNWLSNDGGNEGIRIANNGNVGIGTATMNANLQFDAGENLRKIVLSQTANNVHQVRGFGTRSGEMVYQVDATASDHVWQAGTSSNNSTELVRFTGDGLVGLKTANPKYNLHVNSNNSTTYLHLTNTNTNQTTSDGLLIGVSSNAAFIRQQEAANLHFRTSDINRITIDKDGLVGVGTDSPTGLLTVADNERNMLTLKRSATGSDSTGIAFQNTGNNYTWNIFQNATEDLIISNGANSSLNSLTPRLILDNSGNMGLGTISPESELHVDGTVIIDQAASSDTAMMIRRRTDDSPFFKFFAGSAGNSNMAMLNSSGEDKVLIATGSHDTYFNGGGNVGIGTDNPRQKLHVAGNILLDNNQAIRYRNVANSANYNMIKSNTSNEVQIAGTNSENIQFLVKNAPYAAYITNGGNVGIGTTTPSGNLVVTDSTGSATQFLHAANASGDAYVGLVGNGASKFSYGYDESDTAFKISTVGFGSNEFVMGATGNIGLGIATPGYQLTLHGSNDNGYIYMDSGDEFRIGNDQQDNEILISDGTGGIRFNYNGTEYARIASKGLGIGTTSPQTSLHIDAISSATVGVLVEADVDFAAPVGEDIEFGHANNTSGAISDRRMIIKSDGNVGIGTSSPSYKFEVYDNSSAYVAEFTNTNTSTGDGIRIRLGLASPTATNGYLRFDNNSGTLKGSVAGNGTGVTYNTTSDRRLKMDIVNFESGLNLLNQIYPRQYKWRSNPAKTEIGFIAQELQQVLPQAVNGDSTLDVSESPMLVDYSRITPVLAAGLKELHGLVKQQQTLIEGQQRRIEQLEAKEQSYQELNKSIEIEQKAMKEQLEKLEKLMLTGQVLQGSVENH